MTIRSTTTEAGSLSCRQFAQVLQSFIDREVDERTAGQMAAHLEMCLRCGLEADVYREIKASLSRSTAAVPELARRRLQRFCDGLGSGPGGPSRGARVAR